MTRRTGLLLSLALVVCVSAGCGKQSREPTAPGAAESPTERIIYNDTMEVGPESGSGVGWLPTNKDRKVSVSATSASVPINVYLGIPGKGKNARKDSWESVLATKESAKEIALGATIPAGKNGFLLVTAPQAARVKLKVVEAVK